MINSGHDPDVARRFDRERKAMGRLSNHEGIVPVYSSGITSLGEPYLVMPYYPNGSLQDQIDAGPLDWRKAVTYVDSAADTMAAAHEEGVVHLDIKPANILLTAAGAPRIADFGIAKLASGSGVAARTTGTAFTPAYSAPETFLDGQATPAADVYGLGATLWASLVGHPPFLGPDEDTNLMAVIGRVVNNPLGDVRHLAPDPICQVINQAMAKDPHHRYRTAREFSHALREAMAQVGLGPAVAAAPLQPASDQTAVHQFTPPVPYGVGPEPHRVDQTQVFTDPQPAAAAMAPVRPPAPARTVERGPVLVSAEPAPVENYGGRPLLQQTADVSQYRGGPPPIVERTPLVDFDRLGFGPIVAGLLALIGVGLLAGWALTRDGTTPDSGVASTGQQTAPLGPETEADSQVGDSIDLSLSGSSTTTTLTSTTEPTTESTTATTSATTGSSTTAATTSSESTTTTASTTTTTEPTTTTSTTTTTTTTVVVGDLMPPEDVTAVLVDGDVQLSWSAPSSGPAPTSYIIYRDGELLDSATASPYVDAALAPGTYRYRVAAVGENATESDLSLPATVEIPEPQPLTVTASALPSRTGLSLRVTSEPCMASIRVSYVIEDSGDTPSVEVVDHDPCVDEDTIILTRLRRGETYLVNVTATGVDGGTGAALPLSVTPN